VPKKLGGVAECFYWQLEIRRSRIPIERELRFPCFAGLPLIPAPFRQMIVGFDGTGIVTFLFVFILGLQLGNWSEYEEHMQLCNYPIG
jgi:hypothetical protein